MISKSDKVSQNAKFALLPEALDLFIHVLEQSVSEWEANIGRGLFRICIFVLLGSEFWKF